VLGTRKKRRRRRRRRRRKLLLFAAVGCEKASHLQGPYCVEPTCRRGQALEQVVEGCCVAW